MRNVFFALVLANLGFAAWAAWYAQPQTSSGLITNSRIPGITLISELEEAALETIEELAETEPDSAPSQAMWDKLGEMLDQHPAKLMF